MQAATFETMAACIYNTWEPPGSAKTIYYKVKVLTVIVAMIERSGPLAA